MEKKRLTRQILYLSISYVFFLKGIGYRELFDWSIFAILSFGFCMQWRSFRKDAFLLILMLLSIKFPSVTHLWGFCALMFYYVSPQSCPNILLCLLFWILEFCGISIDNYFIITVLFFVANIVLRPFKNVIDKIVPTFASILIVLTIIDLPIFKASTYIEKVDDSIYSPGEVFQKITDSPYWNKDDTTGKVIRETSFYTKIPDTQPGILVFDIGYNGQNDYVYNDTWQQPVSWNSNQMLGNQYFLEAIRKDGGLWSNKGITMKHVRKGILLSFPKTFMKSQPLIVKHGNTIYLHDSDYFSSFLSNYQKCLLKELTGNTVRPNLIRLINVFFLALLIASFSINRKRKYVEVTIMILLSFTIYVVYLHPTDGNIRMVGEIKNSHENNRFDGVPKKIVNSGYNYVIGDKNAMILVIKSGHHASVEREKIVVAEENSVVMYKGKRLEVKDVPVGNNNGVIDGRLWFCDGKKYSSRIKMDSITFIATGSPALQSWKNLLE